MNLHKVTASTIKIPTSSPGDMCQKNEEPVASRMLPQHRMLHEDTWQMRLLQEARVLQDGRMLRTFDSPGGGGETKTEENEEGAEDQSANQR